MPGILPMKMIRVGGVTTQSRIAQACDRCRSKKIRCDGTRPCCTQCSNVGFECKTSDKLSRRAFPRGYTESLEDRVRGLEAEVRELKDLLDEKDEKIDVLSRIHNFSPISRKNSLSPNAVTAVTAEDEPSREDVITVEIPTAGKPLSSSTGTSTTAALIESFEGKARAQGRIASPIPLTALLQSSPSTNRAQSSPQPHARFSSPPRLLSDQYINLFFQEWQPLLPILHRPTFLKVYERYQAHPEAQTWDDDKHGIAQLFLIFDIAAHSSSSHHQAVQTRYDFAWRKALTSISTTPSIATLQCHILAQLCYLLKADHTHLLRHRACAVSIVHQMSLHQGHRYQTLPVFEAETRKKVFWCQYVLDKFVSATTGTPQLLRDSDITTDYPTDVDDENLNVHGISPAAPGELTKTSSALALFRLSRILGKSLHTLYPTAASFQLSIGKLHSLSDELDQWQEEIPDHLRLRFCNDKPATNIISCRSPLLSLAYFYTRSLIHRPLVCHGSGPAASAATIVLSAAAKHQLQILDLLDERSMNYTFPVSKRDVLLNAGFSILCQSLVLEPDSKLIRDNQRSLDLLLGKLAREDQSAFSNFSKIVSPFVVPSGSRPSTSHTTVYTPPARPSSAMPAPTVHKQSSVRKSFQAIASSLSPLTCKAKHENVSKPTRTLQPKQSPPPNPKANSTDSLSSTKSAPPVVSAPYVSHDVNHMSAVNLDYFPFADDGNAAISSRSSTTMLPPRKVSPRSTPNASWEQLASNAKYNSPEAYNTISPASLDQSLVDDWTQDFWSMPTYDLQPTVSVPHSHLSFSDESLTSGEDLVFSAPTSHHGSIDSGDSLGLTSAPKPEQNFEGISIPVDVDHDDNYGFGQIAG